ncbi:retrovirus-related pol polyprotein from transposon TNT 1-94 [Tanacetum coccineum]
MASNEETNAAGTDTRPPMLVENDYESWKIRIHRYIRGKPNGKLIWKSIQNGPTPHPMVTDPPPANSTVMPAPRKKLDSEFNDEENKLEMADTQAEIILSQGLPRHIFNILNQTSTAKEIWDNVEMLMQGSGRTLQQRKEDLFDEYERFRAIGNESIHDYFVRFHKLVNDMKITQLEIPTHQMNTKFVNNLPAYWGKYVTNVKQNMDISTTPYVQIYTHLKAYEPHAKKTLKKQEQSTSIVDPLAYVAHTTSAPTLSSPSTPSPQPTAQSPNDALMATMTQIANLLSGFQKQFPPTNNQLRTSSNSRTHATVHDGHIVTEPIQRKAPGNVGNTGARGKKVICYNCRGEGHVARQCKEPKRKMDSQYFKDKALLMEAKEKGDVLDVNQPHLGIFRSQYMSTPSSSACLRNVNAVFPQLIGNTLSSLKLKAEVLNNKRWSLNLRNCIDTSSASNAFLKLIVKSISFKEKDTISVSLKRRYDELSKANTHSRTAYTEKINALTAENAKLKTELSGKKSGGSSTSEKPKVLASGMYTKSSKYIPPPKRANWVKPTPLPKKKQVTFQEPPRTSNRPTQKPPVQQNKKPNIPVNQSTRTKPATESRKPMPKYHTRNHHILPSRSVNARRAADHNRKLHVVDHNQFVVRSLNLEEQLERIMEPIVEPLELTPSVSSSSKVSMISRSNGHTVADSIGERLKQPTAYKFKTDCSIIPVWCVSLLEIWSRERRTLGKFDTSVLEELVVHVPETV